MFPQRAQVTAIRRIPSYARFVQSTQSHSLTFAGLARSTQSYSSRSIGLGGSAQESPQSKDEILNHLIETENIPKKDAEHFIYVTNPKSITNIINKYINYQIQREQHEENIEWSKGKHG